MKEGDMTSPRPSPQDEEREFFSSPSFKGRIEVGF